MRVVKLFIKAALGCPMVERDRLILRRGYGIEGDQNAAVGSPRQVLIVDQRSLKQFRLQSGDLYENILVDDGAEGLTSGHLIQIGSVLLRPTFLCEPCAQLNEIYPGLAKYIKGKRGFLGMVITDGAITVGDSVLSTPYRMPTLPSDVKGRFHEFVARIPVGKVVSTANLLEAMGVADAYYRTIPILIKKALTDLPVHRIVAIDGTLFTRHINNQAELLKDEGVELQGDRVHPAHYWQPDQFHPLNFKLYG